MASSDEAHPDDPVFKWLTIARVAAVALLVVALAELSYGYYQFLRWTVCVVAAFTAFVAYSYERRGWTVAFAAAAVLFNPIAPIYLHRETWAVLDLATAALFIVSFMPLRKAKLIESGRR